MTDNKLTDNEIKKALECCSNAEPCENCPYQKQCDETDLAEIALDLINRQQAEIERLQKENNQFSDIGKMYSEIKSEAIKEFAEKLKEQAYLTDHKVYAVLRDDIDNLVKEMVGEE